MGVIDWGDLFGENGLEDLWQEYRFFENRLRVCSWEIDLLELCCVFVAEK